MGGRFCSYLNLLNMKYILLMFGVSLFAYSCVDVPETENTDPEVSDEEMKSRVEAEEIQFEIEEKLKDSSNVHVSADIERMSTPSSLGKMENEVKSIELPRPPICRGAIERTHGKPYNSINPDVIPDIDAQYPGGISEMKKYIQENIQYPDRDVSVLGRVYVSFIVEKDGCVTHVEVMRGISEECDEEALRLVRSMPKWIPAEHNGKVVAARVRLPINFDLY